MPKADEILKKVDKILNDDFWLPGLKTKKLYSRLHDDYDGEPEGFLEVMFDPTGDAYIWITGRVGQTLRFRTPFSGGGISPRVRNALLILARAIELDNKERPARFTSQDSKQTP